MVIDALRGHDADVPDDVTINWTDTLSNPYALRCALAIPGNRAPGGRVELLGVRVTQ